MNEPKKYIKTRIAFGNRTAKKRTRTIGNLMHVFFCSDPNDMINKDLADRSRYFKETEEGVSEVCKVMEDMRNEASVRTYIEACLGFGIKDKEEIIAKLLEKFKFLTREQANKYFA